MGQAQPGEGLLAEPVDLVPPRLLAFRGGRYLGRAVGMGAAAGLFTLLLHGPLGALLVAPFGGALPHVLLAAFLFGALRLGQAGAGDGHEGPWALAYPLAAGLSLAALFPVAAPLGVLLFGAFLGAGLAPDAGSAAARLRHGLALGIATLLASLVFGTLVGARVLGDLSPLAQVTVLGGLWGFVVGAGAVPRHLVESSRDVIAALLEDLPTLEGEAAAFAGRALALHGRVAHRLAPDLFPRPEDYLSTRRALDALLEEVRETCRTWQDGATHGHHEDLAKKLLVAKEQLADATDEEARASYRVLVARLESRTAEAQAWEEVAGRHRSRLQLLETVLEELDLSSQALASGRPAPEALARVRQQLAGRPLLERLA